MAWQYKTIGPLADAVYKKKLEISALKKEQDKFMGKLKNDKAELEEQIYNLLRNQRSMSGGGTVGNVEIKENNYPVVEDVEALHKFVKKTNSWDLLGSIKASAVQQRWDDNKVIPGIGVFKKTSLSITKKK